VKPIPIIVAVLLLGCLVGVLIYLGGQEPAAPPTPTTAVRPREEIRLGLIPERDIFALRQRYTGLADYLSAKLGKRVVLVTANSYDTVLRDLAEKQVDAAFLGSLVAMLTIDRTDAKLLLKTELPDGVSSYRGVICVKQDSPIKDVKDLAGKSLALVRTTTAGNLYPVYLLSEAGLLRSPQCPRFVWVGTHDDAISAVASGQVEAAAAKDLRFKAIQQRPDATPLRVIATSPPMPENTLVVRQDAAQSLGEPLRKVLLAMDATEEGRKVLAVFGAAKFVPCDESELQPVSDMIQQVKSEWSRVGILGAPPRPLTRKETE
jgi:phosphonate transport system substrate-binding protein